MSNELSSNAQNLLSHIRNLAKVCKTKTYRVYGLDEAAAAEELTRAGHLVEVRWSTYALTKK